MKEPHLSLVIILDAQPPQDEFFRDTPREVHESVRRVTRAQRLIVTIQPGINIDCSYINLRSVFFLMLSIDDIRIDETNSQMPDR